MATSMVETKIEVKHQEEDQNSSSSVNAAEHDVEKSTLETPPSFEPAPEGGVRAWFVAGGGAAIFFCTLGFANSFGTFEEYYLTHQLQGESASKVSWIGSLSVFLQFFAGMVGGPLFDRFGEKVIRPAAILHVVALMLLSLCETYWEIMLVQGVLMGLTMGFLQFPAYAAVSQYFDKKRAAALGVVVSGSSIGGIVIPVALSKMLNGSSLGFGWSVRIIGFVILPLMAFACVAIKARLPPRTTQFWILAAYKDVRFMTIIAAFFFLLFGMFTPLFYLPTYAITRGVDPTLAGYLLSVLNGASTFGRIIPGILADKYGRLNVFALGGVLTGVVIFCLNTATSTAGLIVYSVFFGFTSGTVISSGTAAFSVCPKDPRNIGTYLGMGIAIAGLGGLVGPPVNGAIVNTYHSFSQVSLFSGAMCLLGGFIAVLAKLATPQGLLGRI